jgi:hypothetical protein
MEIDRGTVIETFFRHLTDKFQLRRIQQDRAVDTSEASASARTAAPPTAANAVRLHLLR